MVEVVWICEDCPYSCRDDRKTLTEIIKKVHDDCATCEQHIKEIEIEGLSPELSMELFLIGGENLKLRCELEICKIQNRGKELVKGDPISPSNLMFSRTSQLKEDFHVSLPSFNLDKNFEAGKWVVKRDTYPMKVVLEFQKTEES